MLYIALAGFDTDLWVADHFPADLPPEWRLDYLSNAVDRLLLTAAQLQQPTMQHWIAAEAPPSWRVVVPLSAPLPPPGTWSLPVAHLDGVVLERGVEASSLPPELAVCRQFAVEREEVVRYDGAADPLQLRELLTSHRDKTGDWLLLASGRAAPEVVRQLAIIAPLLGIATA